MVACMTGNEVAVKTLVTQPEIDLECRDNEGEQKPGILTEIVLFIIFDCLKEELLTFMREKIRESICFWRTREETHQKFSNFVGLKLFSTKKLKLKSRAKA